ncbi:MAG: hypothetical protein SFY67_18620 [Candidatus Melainabacteria bacterium]|nr:hypothetical protein [Candidatus Melainabacteria bacterium]
MSKWTRLLIAASPLIGAFLIASQIQPLYAEIELLKTDVQNKKQDYSRLEHSLIEKGLLEKKSRTLQEDLAKMKKNLPATDQIDVVLFDMEKMAHETEINLLSVELTDEKKKTSDKDSINAVFEEMGKKLPVAQLPNLPGAKATAKTADAKTADAITDIGLRHTSKRVYLTGNYPELVAFLKKMEDYERVINISDLTLATSAASAQDKSVAIDKVKKFAGDKPVMTFIMNVYYMPGGAQS